MKRTEDLSRTSLRPLFWFLALTYIPTYALELYLLSSGMSFDAADMESLPLLWLLAIMWIPGIAALITTQMEEGFAWRKLGFRIGSLKPYVTTMLAIPAAFGLMYYASWKLGLVTPDWNLVNLTASSGGTHAPTIKDLFSIMLPLSIVGGTAVNALFALGEEIGWRGFLLPRLVPLGRWKAHLYVGMFWGLWHAPLVAAGFNYPADHPIQGVLMMCLMSTVVSVFINELTLRYRSVFLAAWIHGAINSQGLGIWHWLFPGADPFLGGANGLVGMAVWALLSVIVLLIFSGNRTPAP